MGDLGSWGKPHDRGGDWGKLSWCLPLYPSARYPQLSQHHLQTLLPPRPIGGFGLARQLDTRFLVCMYVCGLRIASAADRDNLYIF